MTRVETRSGHALIIRLAGLKGPLWALVAVAIPLLIGQQAPVSITQDLGSSAALPNVSGLGLLTEQGEHGSFRWSLDQVKIWLQPLGYPLRTKLLVQGVRPQDQLPAQLEISSQGRNLGVYELPRSPSEVDVQLPAITLLSINPRLDITSTTFQVPNDRRHLGTVFYQLKQSSGPGLSLPSLWPASALLLSGVLVYFAVMIFSRTRARGHSVGESLIFVSSPRLAFASVLIWGLGLGILNAVVRTWLVFYSWYFVVPPLVALLLMLRINEIPGVKSPGLRAPTVADNLRLNTQYPQFTPTPWLPALLVVGSALCVLAWHILAPFIPSGNGPTDNITWGVAFYGALPWSVQALGVAIVLGALALANGFQIPGPTLRIKPTIVSLRSKTQNLNWLRIIAGLGMLAFSIFPVQYSEGDSTEFDAKIPKGAIWRERELLDFYFKARLWQLLKPWLPQPSMAYALVATLGGWVYLWGAVLIGRALGNTKREMLVLMLALMTVGNILLFFGYIESYALVTVASLFVLWACWQYTQSRLSFRVVGALATLAPLFHGSALWWGPMVVAAWLLHAGQQPREARWRNALADLGRGVAVGVAILLTLGSVMLIDGYDMERLQTGLGEMGGADGRTLMPLFTTTTAYEHYPFFSWAHLGAVVQEQLLVAPLALLTIGIVALTSWRGVLRVAQVVPGLVTLTVGAVSMFFYGISWNPDLGPRNDWDLLSLSALPLSLLAVYLLLRLPIGRARRLALTAYLSVSGVHTAAWVAIHTLGIRY